MREIPGMTSPVRSWWPSCVDAWFGVGGEVVDGAAGEPVGAGELEVEHVQDRDRDQGEAEDDDASPGCACAPERDEEALVDQVGVDADADDGHDAVEEPVELLPGETGEVDDVRQVDGDVDDQGEEHDDPGPPDEGGQGIAEHRGGDDDPGDGE